MAAACWAQQPCPADVCSAHYHAGNSGTRGQSPPAVAAGGLTASLTLLHRHCVPPRIRAAGLQSQSTAEDICLHSFTSCHQRDYPGPPLSFAFSNSPGTDWASLPILGFFCFSRSSLLTAFRDFPALWSQPTGEVGLLFAALATKP